ncbi:beta-N-acetylglucosaminidase [Marinobacter persicus]|uniref:Beta-N-acetylglucosaminidase n=2 Tax=Marinobacter persicus TaxID=930118 RepID=A0A1I3QW94_9GAMM|nr:hyaluronidase [Marinobacter persicus]SFJ38434.1 beta-N-acetylglucosaminidase [Marinobacter persicus]
MSRDQRGKGQKTESIAMTVSLGIIEGFYGPLWSWPERRRLLETLAPHGYGFYLYAPKADAFLRRRWQDPHPEEQARELADFARFCRKQGVRFGVGLSPYEIFNDFDQTAQSHLAAKLRALEKLGLDELAILFDDMRSDHPDLARQQADIMHWVRDHTAIQRLSVCPSYYSDDPVLDRVFGERPAGYLETLGQELDPAIQVFWTGEEVCSREISPGHLKRVGKLLGRKPLLWDNYPVNDGDRMSQHLHLRAFTGRAAANAAWLAGHAINPALQPTLTAIPALTLAESYRLGPDYQYGQAFVHAAREVLGKELGSQVRNDLLVLQDAGLGRLSDERRQALIHTYDAFDHPAASEIMRWLSGEYQVTDEMVETQ